MKTLAFFFVLVSPAFARLGESVTQCRSRYGEESEETKDKTSAKIFYKNGMAIHVSFENGIAKEILFTHGTADTPSTGDPVTATEIKALLESNSGGRIWKEDTAGTSWSTTDDQRTARSNGKFLLIVSNGKTAPAPNLEKDQLEKLKGF